MTAASPAPADLRRFEITSLEQMNVWGRHLGEGLRVGDVIGLVGLLGAGKTTLTQAIAAGAGILPGRHVASPTFALVNEHPGRVRLVHADLYRVRNAAELAELGLDEAFDRAAAVIEWIDRFPEAAPADHLRVTIAVHATGGTRTLLVESHGPSSHRLLAHLR